MNPIHNNNPLFKPSNAAAQPKSVVDAMLQEEVNVGTNEQKREDNLTITPSQHRVSPKVSVQPDEIGFATNSKLTVSHIEGEIDPKECKLWMELIIELEEQRELWANEAMGLGLQGGASGTYVFKKMDEYLAENPLVNELSEKLGFGRLNNTAFFTNFRSNETLIQKYDPNLGKSKTEETSPAPIVERERASAEKLSDSFFADFQQAFGLMLDAQKSFMANFFTMGQNNPLGKNSLSNQWRQFLNDTPMVKKFFA